MSETGNADDRTEDHAYFRQIEEIFIGLRGAPLLLAPGDWHIAREWHRQGIPLAVVTDALQTLFARLEEEGRAQRVQGLKYCRAAVEERWAAVQDLRAPRETPVEIDPAEQLERLACAVEASAHPSPEWANRIRSLEGAPIELEKHLQALDQEVLEALVEATSATVMEAITAAVDEDLTTLRGRLSESELKASRRRLVEREIRRRAQMPVLSLLTPQNPRTRAPESR